MTYPRPFMSITELTELGLPRSYLKQLSRIKGAPIIKTLKGGKIYFVTADLTKFMQQVSEKGGTTL